MSITVFDGLIVIEDSDEFDYFFSDHLGISFIETFED